MSAAPAPPWPGSRVLLGWWRQLSGQQPRQLWLSHLRIHRIEGLVRVRRTQPLDPWQRAFLHLLDARAAGDPKSALDDLQMDRQILTRFCRQLTEAGLVQTNGTGAWELTAAGRQALATGARAIAEEERRAFCFVDNTDVHHPPHFLPILGALTQPPTEARPFDPAHLESCVRQTAEWKSRYHFPMDVEALLPPRSEESPAENWRRVFVDSPQQLTFAFIRPPDGAPLLGFLVHPEGWKLEAEPVLRLTEGWSEALPDLAAEPALEAWRQAWQEWSHPRGLPANEVDACRLERVDHRLLVHAPPRLIERLRTARSDAVKGESWLLAGSGRTRAAAQIELLLL